MSSNLFQKVMITAVSVLIAGIAVNVTMAQETVPSTTKNVFFAGPNDDALNARKEEPYLHPKDCDKFYGKLPRLYLHGNWKMMIVPNTGKKPGHDDFFFDDRGMTEGFTKAGYDDTKWDDFYVPQKIFLTSNNKYGLKFAELPPVPPTDEYGHPVPKAKRPDPTSAEGYSYLATRFTLPPGMQGKRVILRLEAADNLPVIFVNGKEAGRGTTFALGANADRHAFDITPYLNRNAINRLVVRTYNIFYEGTWMDRKYSYNLNGVWASAWLEFWPDVRVDTMKLTPDYPEGMTGAIKLINAGAMKESKVKVVVQPWRGIASLAVDDESKKWEYSFPVSLASGNNQTNFTMPLPGIKPWDIATPYLYSVKVFVDGELAGWDTFGMRILTCKSGRILLNGKPIYLFGVELENNLFNDGDDGSQLAKAHNKNGYLAGFLTYCKKEMGMNSTTREMNSPEIFYQLHDELGMMRTDEMLRIDPYWGITRLAAHFNPFYIGVFSGQDDRVRQYYQRIVELNFNHPSIFAWGSRSEVNHLSRAAIDWYVDVLRTLDKTRLKFIETDGPFVNFNPNGKPPWEHWKPNDGPEVDFLTTHDRPFTYSVGTSLGTEIDELKYFEYRSLSVYPKTGGVPLLGSPALLDGMGGNYLPWRPEDLPHLSDEQRQQFAELQKLIGADGNYDKTAFCDFFLLNTPRCMNSIKASHVSLKLIGVADWVLGTPRKYQYKAFENQRLGELMRLHSKLFTGFTSHQFIDILPPPAAMDAKVKGVLNPAMFKPGYMSRYMQRMQQPVLPMLDWHMKHNLFSGEKAKFTLTVLNDSVDDIPAGTVAAHILTGSAFDNFDGKEANPQQVYQKSFTVPAIPSAGRSQQEITLDIPENLNPGRYTMELVYSGNDNLKSSNCYPINIGDRKEVKLSCTKRIALYESGVVKPGQPLLSKILSDTGVAFDRLKDLNKINDYQVLIIAPYSIDAVVKASGGNIQTWLKNGGILLCLEQDIKGRFPFLPQAELILAQELPDHSSFSVVRAADDQGLQVGFHVTEPIEKKHPIFQGINDIKDFDSWNGSKGRVYSSIIKPLSESVLLFGGLSGGHFSGMVKEIPSQFGMVAAEVREGNGVCIFSQVEAVMRYDTDPVARRYLRQLLAYTFSPDAGKYARPLRVK